MFGVPTCRTIQVCVVWSKDLCQFVTAAMGKDYPYLNHDIHHRGEIQSPRPGLNVSGTGQTLPHKEKLPAAVLLAKGSQWPPDTRNRPQMSLAQALY